MRLLIKKCGFLSADVVFVVTRCSLGSKFVEDCSYNVVFSQPDVVFIVT